EVLPVHHQVYGEGNLVLADDMGEFDLVGVRFGSRDPVGRVLAGILEAELNVVETCSDQRVQPLFRETDAGRDEIGIEARGAGGGDQFGEVGAGERFAAGEMRVQHA